MLKRKKTIPLDYSLCTMTVTVYRREGLTRHVLEGVFYEETQRKTQDVGREAQEMGFLLIIPGNVRYGDYSPQNQDECGDYSPQNQDGYGEYSPQIQNEYGEYSPQVQNEYGDYRPHIQPGDRVYGGYGPHIRAWVDTAGFATVESVKQCRFRGQICHTEARG